MTLHLLNLPTLATRRELADIYFVYKLIDNKIVVLIY